MSILRSLNTGASGLRAHGEAIGATGDNIANVNTIGYKKGQARFSDLLGRAPGSEGTPVAGAGVSMAGISHVWSQGGLLTTENTTDLAIQGNGLFTVTGTVGGTTGDFYSRAGQFTLDKDGYLVNPDDLRVQGYSVQPDGSMGGTVDDLQLAANTIPANPSTAVNIAANLDANAVVPPAWDPTDPSGTSNFATSVTAYDSLGNAHDVTVYFRNQGANAWEWHAMVDGGDLTGGVAGTPTEGANGTLSFTTNGELDNETTVASSWDFVNATAAQAIAFDFGTSITGDTGTGLDATTQFGSPSTVNDLSQDGYAAGSVSALAIASDGTITGVFSNGQRRPLGQLALSNFSNIDALARAGNGLWSETVDSGEPLVGMAESGGRGSIASGALEQSNVDIGKEFVDLIAYQRGFQANSRIVTTADEMYSELVNLKR